MIAKPDCSCFLLLSGSESVIFEKFQVSASENLSVGAHVDRRRSDLGDFYRIAADRGRLDSPVEQRIGCGSAGCECRWWEVHGQLAQHDFV